MHVISEDRLYIYSPRMEWMNSVDTEIMYALQKDFRGKTPLPFRERERLFLLHNRTDL